MKIEKTQVNIVDLYDLEALIEGVYNIKDYSLVAMEEWGNDQTHYFPDVKSGILTEYDLDDLKHIRTKQYNLDVIIKDLINRHILEPGNYLIQVSW